MQASTPQFADPVPGHLIPDPGMLPHLYPFGALRVCLPKRRLDFFFPPKLRGAVAGSNAQDRGQEARTGMDEGRPPGKACTVGKGALGPSRPHPRPRPWRASRARSVLLAQLHDNDG